MKLKQLQNRIYVYQWIPLLFFLFTVKIISAQPSYIIVTQEKFDSVKTQNRNGIYCIFSDPKVDMDHIVIKFEIWPYKNGILNGRLSIGENHYYPDTVKTKYSYIVNYKDSIEHGYFLVDNPHWLYEGYYSNGLKEGVWKEEECADINPKFDIKYITYHKDVKNGKFEMVDDFVENVYEYKYITGDYKNNLKKGQWYYLATAYIEEFTYENDTLNGNYCKLSLYSNTFTQGSYNKGKRNGKEYKYGKYGTLRCITTYNNGEITNKYEIPRIEIDSFRCASDSIIMVTIPDFKEKNPYFNRSMMQKKIADYKDQYTLNKEEYKSFYDSTSHTKSEGILKNGKKEGKWLYKNNWGGCWYEASLEFQQGVREGDYQFKTDGYAVKGKFAKGLKDGKWIYDYKGQEPLTKIYKEGVEENSKQH